MNYVKPLGVGTKVKFHGRDSRLWWTTTAEDHNFSIMIRQRPFKVKGEYLYTILDREKGIRGPCNLIGQGWDISLGTEKEDCELLLKSLQVGKLSVAEMNYYASPPDYLTPVEISHRNRTPINILEVKYE